MDARYCNYSDDKIKYISHWLIYFAKDNNRTWLIFWSLLRMGVRINELIRLQKEDVIWESNTLKITYRTNLVRTIPFNAEYKCRLERYLMSRTDNNPTLFVKKTGTDYYQGEIRKLFKPICRMMCVPFKNINSHFYLSSSILYLLSEEKKSITEITGILGYTLISKLIYFCKSAGLIQPHIVHPPENLEPLSLCDETVMRVAELKRLILEEDK